MLLPVFTAFLGVRPLSVPDEGRYPEVAREMLLTGDFITPRVNGIGFLDKPALYYWLEAGSMHVFGVNAWAIRLPPALFGVLGVIVIFITADRLFSRRAAWWSAAILATSPLYFLASQYADMNIEIAVCVTCALCFFLLAKRLPVGARGRRGLFMLAWLAIGLGVLTKGLIGLLFPMMVMGTWVLLNRRWRELAHWHFLSGTLLMLLICLPWFVAVQRANGQFLHYFFVYQQFERFIGDSFNNAQPFWFYIPVLIAGLLPWVFLLPHCLRNQWHLLNNDNSPAGISTRDSRQIVLLWPLLVLIFFSLPASKIVGYILPVMPPLSLLLGDFLARRFPTVAPIPMRTEPARKTQQDARPARALPWFAVVAMAISIGAIAVTARFDSGIRPIAQTLQQTLSPEDKLICYRNYYQDLPIYLRTTRPLTIVDNWRDPDILKQDDWRREFYLNLAHQPEARDWLIDENKFADLLARQKPGERIFVLARARDAQRLMARYPLSVLRRAGKQVLLVMPAERLTAVID